MTVDGSMELLAVTARRYGNVDPDDDDAVIEFLENNAEKIPLEEAEGIVAALLESNQPRAAAAFDADEVIPELEFPKLDDARREAKLCEQRR